MEILIHELLATGIAFIFRKDIENALRVFLGFNGFILAELAIQWHLIGINGKQITEAYILYNIPIYMMIITGLVIIIKTIKNTERSLIIYNLTALIVNIVYQVLFILNIYT